MNISQKIIDYAIWYYLRYYPSTKKLSQKLVEKFGPESERGKKYGGISDEEISYICSEKLRNIINEGEVLLSKIKSLQKKGKNLSYIKGNLLKKGFLLSEIQEILEQEFYIGEQSFLDKSAIFRKIVSYKKKGKSKNYVKNMCVERNLDRGVVEEIIQEVFGDSEYENLQKEFQKLEGRYEKNKIIEKLLRKGFIYDDVKLLFDN